MFARSFAFLLLACATTTARAWNTAETSLCLGAAEARLTYAAEFCASNLRAVRRIEQLASMCSDRRAAAHYAALQTRIDRLRAMQQQTDEAQRARGRQAFELCVGNRSLTKAYFCAVTAICAVVDPFDPERPPDLTALEQAQQAGERKMWLLRAQLHAPQPARLYAVSSLLADYDPLVEFRRTCDSSMRGVEFTLSKQSSFSERRVAFDAAILRPALTAACIERAA